MKLKDYMNEMCVNISDFARRAGVTYPTMVSLLDSKHDISLALAIRIENLTEGKVSCRDLTNYPAIKILEKRADFFRDEAEKKKQKRKERLKERLKEKQKKKIKTL